MNFSGVITTLEDQQPKQYLQDITIPPPLLLVLRKVRHPQNGGESSAESFLSYAM